MKLSFKMPNYYNILIFLLWGKLTIYAYFEQVLARLPIVWSVSYFIWPALILLLCILNYKKLLQNINGSDIVATAVVILIILASFIDNSKYIVENFIFFAPAMLWFFLGKSFDYEETKKTIYFTSALGILFGYVYQIYCLMQGKELETDQMNFAYGLVPSVLFVLFYAMYHKDKKSLLFAILGTVLLVMLGTRGPLACVIVFIVIYYFLTMKRRKPIITFAINFTVLVFGYVFVFTDIIKNILVKWAESISNIGFSTRIIDFLLEGEIMSDGGRNEIANLVFNATKEKPFWGYGFMGDRGILEANGYGAYYAHNIFLEFWSNFGFVFGSVFLAIIIALIFRACKITKEKEERYFVVMISVMCLVWLMFSSSYLYNQYFFLVIGFSKKIIEDYKRQCKILSYKKR